MHYIYERRLNMLEIAVHALSDAELADFGLPQRLLDDHRVFVPDLELEKIKESFKEKEIAPGEGPDGFELRKTEKVGYYRCTVPFTFTDLVEDILPMRVCAEGLSITPKEAYYSEWSHQAIDEKDSIEKQELRSRAEKAFADLRLSLAEFAANSEEFNQLVLPVAISEKIQAERLFRFEMQLRKNDPQAAYSA